MFELESCYHSKDGGAVYMVERLIGLVQLLKGGRFVVKNSPNIRVISRCKETLSSVPFMLPEHPHFPVGNFIRRQLVVPEVANVRGVLGECFAGSPKVGVLAYFDRGMTGANKSKEDGDESVGDEGHCVMMDWVVVLYR